MLVHRKHILFANSRFLALLGVAASDVIGKPLTDFVAPEYVELVENNLRRRLAGEPSAERYEVELVGLHGEVTRVELSSTLIDSAGEPALLITALEMLPITQPAIGASAEPRAMATLDAMGESVITVDAEGRIDYINHAAETLLGQSFDQVVGKFFADVASLGRRIGPALARRSGAQGALHRRPRHHGQARRSGTGQRLDGALGGDQRDAAQVGRPRKRSASCWSCTTPANCGA